MPAVLSAAQLAHDLSIPDLTDPEHGLPAMHQLIDGVTGALAGDSGASPRIIRGEPVVAISDNYDDLGYDPDAVTRDERYSRYVDAGRMLRSHSTALIPRALRTLAADPLQDVILVCPAMAYRRDSIDRIHTGTPHQLDLWRICRRPLSAVDLDRMIEVVLSALTPGRPYRQTAKTHPYTVDGRELNVLAGDAWVEVGECGLAAPAVLSRAGLVGWSGLAMGLGLDRILMLRKGIPDIRLLRSSDPRVRGQLDDLRPYRPVSDLPPVARDVSVAVTGELTAEEIGDRVRNSLGADADLLEAVRILSETSYEQLPERARLRLGIRPEQKNLLIRMVIRPYDATLTDAQANVLRDRVHAAIHEGAEE